MSTSASGITYSGIIYNKTSRMIAVHNETTKVLHTYYGLDVSSVIDRDEASRVIAKLCLEGSPLDQFKALLIYRSDKTGTSALDGVLMGWARNVGLSNHEIASVWVDHFFPE